MFTFSVKMEIPFSCKYGVKNQNCQFILKFGTKTNSNMWNSMVVWNFSVFDQKYPFWANFVQKFKVKFYGETNSNYAEFSGGVHLICFRQKLPFLGKFGP